MRLNKKVMELYHVIDFCLTIGFKAEVVTDILEELYDRELWIKDVGDLTILIQSFEQSPDNGCFTRSDFARKHDEALSLFNPVDQLG